jgi:hypothetical protein
MLRLVQQLEQLSSVPTIIGTITTVITKAFLWAKKSPPEWASLDLDILG